MEIFDVSVPIHNGMHVWPGDAGVEIERVRLIEDGANANVSRYSLGSHTGTHVDAPLHFIGGGDAIDVSPLDLFFGPAELIAIRPTGRHLVAADFAAASIPPGTTRLLLKTPNEALWESPSFREDFVAIELDGARWLTSHGIRLVGIDYLSIAPFGNSKPTHLELLGNGCHVVEGLNFRGVEPGSYTLSCLPLRVAGGDGSPARAVLVRG